MDSGLRNRVEDSIISKRSCSIIASCANGSIYLTDDVRYWMPIRHNPLERPESLSDELAKPGEDYYFDDDIQQSAIRVERVYAKNAWARCRRRARAI